MRLTKQETSDLGKHTGHYFVYNKYANKESNPYIDKLGQLEDIEEKHNISSSKDLDKRLTALEIIKETPEFAWYVKIYKNAYEMVSDAKGFRLDNSVKELQEMFDLLKEVLL